MDETTLAAIKEICEALKADIASSVGALDTRVSALADSVADLKKKADAAGAGGNRHNGGRMDNDDDTMAERTAADSVHRSEFAALASSVADLRKRTSRPMSDLDAFADVQSKADAVMRTHCERAEPPMAGEDLVAYKIRMHRKMQPHSPKWKGVDLGLIVADSKAFENVLAEIRADALQAGLNPVGLPEFQHRKITETMPGGHLVTRFVGTGTIFKQLSRPVRHVEYIGTRNVAAGKA